MSRETTRINLGRAVGRGRVQRGTQRCALADHTAPTVAVSLRRGRRAENLKRQRHATHQRRNIVRLRWPDGQPGEQVADLEPERGLLLLQSDEQMSHVSLIRHARHGRLALDRCHRDAAYLLERPVQRVQLASERPTLVLQVRQFRVHSCENNNQITRAFSLQTTETECSLEIGAQQSLE